MNWDAIFKDHEIVLSQDGWTIKTPKTFMTGIKEALLFSRPSIYVSKPIHYMDDFIIVGSVYEEFKWMFTLTDEESISLAEYCHSRCPMPNYVRPAEKILKEKGVIG